MSDDRVSQYETLANTMLGNLNANAVVIVVAGGRFGNGACPALRLRQGKSPEVIAYSTRLVRTLSAALQGMAQRLAEDIVAAGF